MLLRSAFLEVTMRVAGRQSMTSPEVLDAMLAVNELGPPVNELPTQLVEQAYHMHRPKDKAPMLKLVASPPGLEPPTPVKHELKVEV